MMDGCTHTNHYGLWYMEPKCGLGGWGRSRRPRLNPTQHLGQKTFDSVSRKFKTSFGTGAARHAKLGRPQWNTMVELT